MFLGCNSSVVFSMRLKLRCYQLKVQGCNDKIIYTSFELTKKKKKPMTDTQNIKRKQLKQITG